MNLFSAALIESAELALNLLLKTRPLMRERLLKLNGRSMRIVVLPNEQQLVVHFNAQGVELSEDSETETDAEIRGTPAVLLRLVTEPRSVLFGQGADIRGDAALIQRIKKAMRDADIDWELWLSDQIGDAATAALLEVATPTKQFISKSAHSLSDALQAYLHEELKILPGRTEFDIWTEECRQLQNRSEALERRVHSLTNGPLKKA